MSSNNVDNRVVNLEFNNAQFEAGVKQTLGSLEELKKSLQFNNAMTGITTLSSAFNSFSLSNISSQVSDLSNKFSALGIVGVTALQNITNKVMNIATGKISSVIGQITSGGWGRASSIAQARFTLQGLLKDTKLVEQAFQSASDAVDGTAYSLDSAVSVASQLAASGVDVGEDMKNTLLAIGGTAAMTGAQFDEIGSIFTTVAGQGKLMTMQLRQMESRGLNAAAEVAKYLGTSEAAVREMTTKGQIDFDTFSAAMQSAFGEHAKEANKTFAGSMDNIKSALSRIGAIFSSGIIENDALIETLNDVRKTINKIKEAMLPLEDKFKNLVTQVSKLVSSLLGDIEFTSFNDFVDNVGKAMDYIAGLAARWRVLNDGFKESIFGKVAEEVEEANKDIYASQELIDKAMDIWTKGAYGTGQARIDALEAEAEGTSGIVQYLVNQLASGNTDLEHVAINSLVAVEDKTEDVGDTADETASKVKNIATSGFSIVNIFKSISHFGNGIKTIFNNIKITVSKLVTTFKKVFSWKDLYQDLADYGDLFSKFVGYFDLSGERSIKLENALSGLWSVLDTIRIIIKSVVTGLVNGFGPALSIVFDIILTVTSKIGELITKFKDWYKQNDILQTALKTLGSIISSVVIFIKNFFAQLSQMDSLNRIKDGIISLADSVSEKLSPYFETAIEKIKAFFDEMNSGESSKITEVVDGLNTALNTLIDYVSKGKDGITEFISSITSKIPDLSSLTDKFDGISGGIENMQQANAKVNNKQGSIPFLESLIELGKKLGSGLWERIKNIKAWQVAIAGFGVSLTVLTFNLSSFVSTIKGAFESFGQIGESIQNVFNSISDVFVQIKKNIAANTVLNMLTKVTLLIAVLAASIIGLSMMDTKKMLIAAAVLEGLLLTIAAVAIALSLVVKRQEWSDLLKMKDIVAPLSAMFLALSASVLILALALERLSYIDTDGIWTKFAVLASITAVLTGMVIAISHFAPQISTGSFAMISYAAAVYILCAALSKLNNADISGAKDKLLTLAGVIIVVGLVASIASTVGGINAATGFGLIAIIGSILLLEMTLKYITENGVDLNTIKNNLSKFIVIFGILALLVVSIGIINRSTGKVLGNILLLLAIVFSLKLLATTLITLTNAVKSGGILGGLISLALIFTGIIVLMKVITKGGPEIYKSAAVLVGLALAVSILAMVAALIGNLPIKKLLIGLAAIAAIMTLIGAFIVIVSRLSEEDIDYKPILAMAGAVVAIGLMLALLTAITDKKGLIISAIAIGLVLIALAGAYYIAGRESEKIRMAPLITLIASLMVITAMLAALTAVQKLGSIGKSTLALIAVLAAIVAAYYIIAKSDMKLDAKSIGGLATIVSSLLTIAGAIATITNAQKNGSILPAVVSILLILAAIVAGIKVLSKDVKLCPSALASLVVMVFSLLIVAASLRILLNGDYSWSEMLVGALTMILVLGAVVAALAILSGIGSAGPMAMAAIGVAALALSIVLVSFSVAMVAFARSIKILVECVKSLSEIDYEAINVVVLAQLCGILALFGITATVASVGIVALAVAIALLAIDISIIAVASAILVPNIVKLVNAFTKFILLGTLLATGMDVAGDAIVSLIAKIGTAVANGINNFIQAIAANSPIIVTNVNIIFLNILTGLVSFVNSATVVIAEGILSFLDIIDKYGPAIIEKATDTLINLLTSLAKNASKFAVLGALIVAEFTIGILKGLSEKIGDILQAAADFAISFIYGVADTIYNNTQPLLDAMAYLGLVLLRELVATFNIGGVFDDSLAEIDGEIEYQKAQRKEEGAEAKKAYNEGVNSVDNAEIAEVDTSKAEKSAKKGGANSADAYGTSFIETAKSKAEEYGLSGDGSGWKSMLGLDDTSNIFGGAGNDAGSALLGDMQTGFETETMDVTHVPANVVEDLKKQGWKLEEGGKTMTREIQSGLNSEEMDLSPLNDEVINNIGADPDELTAQGNEDKDYYIDGLVNVSDEDLQKVREAYARIGHEAHEAVVSPEGLDESSPSHKGEQAGVFYTQGLIIGGLSLANKLVKAYAGMANEATTKVATIMQSISTAIQDNSADWTPTITPVFDGTQLQNGSNLLNNTFGTSALNMAANTSLAINNSSENNLATQVQNLSDQVNKLANTDYSKMLEGVNVNVNAETNVDGTPLKKMASKYTVNQINDQVESYNMALGGRA